MMQFVEMVSGRWINLDEIREFGREHDDDSTRFVAYGKDGERLGMMRWDFDPAMIPVGERIVSAGFPVHAAVIGCYSEGTRPRLADVFVEYRLVLAWRIVDFDYAVPILAEPLTKEQTLALPMVENRWQVPHRQTATLQDLKEQALEEAQARWDKAQVEKAA